MKMHEILLDSIKYPLLGWKQLILFGLANLIFAAILGNYDQLYTYFDTNSSNLALFSILIISLLALIFSTFLEAGYSFKIIEKSVKMIETPPKFSGFISMTKHGFNETLILFIYFLMPFISLLALIDDISTQLNFGIPPIPDNIFIWIIFLTVILGFIADIFFTVAIPHMAFKGGSLKDAFNFIEIANKMNQIGLKRLIIGYLLVIIGVVVIGGPILKEAIKSINLFGFVIAELIVAPYIIMFSARFIALIYRE